LKIGNAESYFVVLGPDRLMDPWLLGLSWSIKFAAISLE
jgi:hypothetical protein